MILRPLPGPGTFARDNAKGELGMGNGPFLNLRLYRRKRATLTAEDMPKPRAACMVKKLSGTQFARCCGPGRKFPEWFAFRSVVEVLREGQL